MRVIKCECVGACHSECVLSAFVAVVVVFVSYSHSLSKVIEMSKVASSILIPLPAHFVVSVIVVVVVDAVVRIVIVVIYALDIKTTPSITSHLTETETSLRNSVV